MTGVSRIDGVVTAVVAPSRTFRLDRPSWERISAAASVYSGWHHMQFMNSFSPEGTGFVLATDQGRLVGALPFYLAGGATSPLYRIDIENTSVLRDLRDRPGVIAGGCSGYRSDALVDPGLPAWQRGAICADMFTTLGNAVAGGDIGPERQSGSWLAWPYLGAEDARLIAPHLGRDRAAGASLQDKMFLSSRVAGCGLDVSPGDFEHFVAGLPKRRRPQLRKEWRQAATSRIEADTVYREPVRLAQLLDEVETKHGQHEPRSHYLAIIDSYQRYMRDVTINFYLMSADGMRIEAFSTFFIKGDTLAARTFGALNHVRVQAEGAYLALMFHAPLRYAFETGCQRIDLSPATRAKYLRGGRTTGSWGLVGAVRAGSFAVADGAGHWNDACQAEWQNQYSGFTTGAVGG